MNEARHQEAEQRLWRSLRVSPSDYQLDLRRIGATIRVQELGDGPTVVFVHGGSISGTSWASLAARLPDFRCVMIDRPGCGLSRPLATTFHDVDALGAFADNLVVDVLDALGLERADLVATSFGGYLALRAAATHPDRIGRMVEFGWPIGAPVGRTPVVMRVATAPLIGRLLASIPPTERGARAMLRSIGLGQALEAGRITPEMMDWFLSLLRDTDTMRNEIRAGPRIIHPLRGLNRQLLLPANLLASVRTPLYFLWGEQDPFGGAAIASSFVKHFPDAELQILRGAGHAVWMDDAELAAETVRRFLSVETGGR